MRSTYTIDRDKLEPPEKNKELALFTCAIQSVGVRKHFTSTGNEMPKQFQVVHLSNPDDPPDLHAFGLGWECTEFPDDLSALRKVHDECGEEGMIVPDHSETHGDINKIRKLVHPESPEPTFVNKCDTIASLENAFLTKVIGGPKSKDISGNDVLMLDNRNAPYGEDAVIAIQSALQKKRPKYIKLILLVGWDYIKYVPRTTILWTQE